METGTEQPTSPEAEAERVPIEEIHEEEIELDESEEPKVKALAKSGDIPVEKEEESENESDDSEDNDLEEGQEEQPEPENPTEENEEEENPLEILEPKSEHKRWIIGKHPDLGGDKDEYSVYIQKPLGWMPMQRWTGLVFRTISTSIKESGAVDIGMQDVFGDNAGSIRQRMSSLTNQDFADAGQFMALIAQLFAQNSEFMLDSYLLWLDVPPDERRWARATLNQTYDPDREKWGLTHEQGYEILEVFIDQNYSEFRSFFTERLPKLVTRMRNREREFKGRKSKSQSSKP